MRMAIKVYVCRLNAVDGDSVLANVNKRLLQKFLSLELRQQPITVISEDTIESDPSFTWARR